MDFIFKNSFNVLGLDGAASEKDALKRSREIINRLGIGDVPEYESDLNFFQLKRDDYLVKDAIQRIQSSKKRVFEHFFWFNFSNEVDKQASSYIHKWDVPSAVLIWDKYLRENPTDFNSKRNLTLLLTFSLFLKFDKSQLKYSLDYWKELISDEKFWNDYLRIYVGSNPQTSTKANVDELRLEIASVLSDIFTEIHKKYPDENVLSTFSKYFSSKGKQVDNEILHPVLERINKAVSTLEKLEISKDNVYDKQEKETVSVCVRIFKDSLDELKKYNLHEDKEVIIVRDRVANNLRKIFLELHNDLNELEHSLELVEFALIFAGTEGVRANVQRDLDVISNNKDFKDIIEPILNAIKYNYYKDAYNSINHNLLRPDISKEIKEYLLKLKQDLDQRTSRHGDPIKSPPTMRTVNGVGTKIYGDTLYFVFFFIPICPIGRYSLQAEGNAYRFFGKLPFHNWQKIWLYAFLGVVGIIIFNSFSSSGSSSSYQSNNYNNRSSYNSNMVNIGEYRCSKDVAQSAQSMISADTKDKLSREDQELRRRDENLKTQKAQLESFKENVASENDRSEYNDMVRKYNTAVMSFREEANSLDKKISEYNAQIKDYRNYIETNCTKRGN